MSPARKKHAEIAISSAISTLRVVLDEPDIQRSLVGIPLYLHSMITFAAVFLLKIAVKGHSGELPGSRNRQNSIALADLNIDIPLVRDLVEEIVGLMLSISKQANERHVSHHIARGLGKMLDGFRLWEKRNRQSPLRKHQKWLQRSSSLYSPGSLSGSPALSERDTLLPNPAPLLGVAPLSAERSNGFASSPTQEKAKIGLSEGSLDPMMADVWGYDEEYFPTGVFDFLQSQMPA
jgi:hypothetical protein